MASRAGRTAVRLAETSSRILWIKEKRLQIFSYAGKKLNKATKLEVSTVAVACNLGERRA